MYSLICQCAHVQSVPLLLEPVGFYPIRQLNGYFDMHMLPHFTQFESWVFNVSFVHDDANMYRQMDCLGIDGSNC